MKEFDLKYGFQIGIILRKKVFQVFVETETFKKGFIVVGFSEDNVHYLPKKTEGAGPRDGSAPGRVP